jgi:cytidylate kinase
MLPLELVKSYVKAMQLTQRPGSLHAPQPFVCLSRQAGAGGHTFARHLLNRLNEEEPPHLPLWTRCDRELCLQLLEDPRIDVSLGYLESEHYRGATEDLLFNLLSHETPQDVVLRHLFQLIRRIAQTGHTIFIGRAAGLVTRDLPGCIHIRLVAPEAVRIKRMAEQGHLSQRDAQQLVHRLDNDRARLVKNYFLASIDDPLLYDLIINTSNLPLDEGAQAVLALIQKRRATLAEKENAVTPFQP